MYNQYLDSINRDIQKRKNNHRILDEDKIDVGISIKHSKIIHEGGLKPKN